MTVTDQVDGTEPRYDLIKVTKLCRGRDSQPGRHELGHEIFDPEIGKRVLVDHASIVAGGEIRTAARSWLDSALDASGTHRARLPGQGRSRESMLSA